jgi:F-type H+-transporting ATPase subunit epsilon
VPLIHVDVVTAEKTVYSADVDAVTLTTVDGQVSVLSGHVPLVTLLQAGEMVARLGENETYLAVSGGFAQVTRDGIVVLADTCERAEEIDVRRAQEAERRAQELLRADAPEAVAAAAEAALRRSVARLRVADKHRLRMRRRVGQMYQ